MFFTCFGKYYCVYSIHPCMMSLMLVLKQDHYLHKYRIFLSFNCTLFCESYVCFMSCHVTEIMLYCIQTIYRNGYGETVHTSIQCWVIICMTAKCHLNGVSLAGRCWPAYGGIWVVSPLINIEKKTLSKSDPLWQNFLDPCKMRKLV